jgi:ribosomal protein L17
MLNLHRREVNIRTAKAMAKPFNKLRAKMTPAARQRSVAHARELIAATPLHEPRQVMHKFSAVVKERHRNRGSTKL